MIIPFLTRTLLAVYFIQAGLILIVAPWSAFWERNIFPNLLPALEPVLSSPFVRGGVSGIGAITVVAGIVELSALLLRHRQPVDGDSPGGGGSVP